MSTVLVPTPENLDRAAARVADDELVTADTAVDHVGDAVDLVLRGEPQDTTRASTILDLVDDRTVLRNGDVTADDVQEVAGFLPD